MPNEDGIYALFSARVDEVLLPMLSADPSGMEAFKRVKEELDPWLRQGALEVAAEPQRLPEAMRNLEKLLRELMPKFAMGVGGGGFKSVRQLFDWICPLYPFC